MEVGKQMQFFGARVNASKALLYAINGGRDEVTGKQVVEGYDSILLAGLYRIRRHGAWRHFRRLACR